MSDIGFCMLMLANEVDPLASRYIPVVKQAGFDYAEIPLAKIYALDDSELLRYKKAFADEGLPIEAFNNGIPDSVHLLGGKEAEMGWKQYIERAMYLADTFSISVMTSSAPHRFAVPETFKWENYGRDQYVEFLKCIGESCKQHGIRYAIEPICCEEQGFVNTVMQASELIDLAGCSNIGIAPDFFHMRVENDGPGVLPELIRKKQIIHIHYADPTDRKTPIPEHVDIYRKELQPLLDCGYDGRISVESTFTDPETQIDLAHQAMLFCKTQKMN